ncbi:MAG: sigma-70 family RNA polymerase sigma factor [Verrucomicrobiota bacterium]
MPDAADEFIPTRRTLLSRLKDWDDQESWRDFFNTYWRLIYSVARKSGLSDAEAQEVVQETVISVAKKMGDFKYDPARGSFKGWLLQLTRWRIADQLRRRLPLGDAARPGDDTARTGTIERVADPESLRLDAVWDEEWERNLMDAALARVKRQVNPRHYQIFDLYVLKKWPVGKVASTLGVNVAQVYLAKHRVASLLKRQVKLLEGKLV